MAPSATLTLLQGASLSLLVCTRHGNAQQEAELLRLAQQALKWRRPDAAKRGQASLEELQAQLGIP